MRIADEIKIKKIKKIIKKGLQKKNVCRRLEEWTEADTPTSRPRGWGAGRGESRSEQSEVRSLERKRKASEVQEPSRPQEIEAIGERET